MPVKTTSLTQRPKVQKTAEEVTHPQSFQSSFDKSIKSNSSPSRVVGRSSVGERSPKFISNKGTAPVIYRATIPPQISQDKKELKDSPNVRNAAVKH